MFKINLSGESAVKGWQVINDIKKNLKVRFSKISTFLSTEQEKGMSVSGVDLIKDLKKRPWRIPLGAGSIKFFLRNGHRIPQHLKGVYLVFLGTTYLNSDGRKVVRCLYNDGHEWREDFLYLEEKQFSNRHQVVYLSIFRTIF